MIFSRCLHSLVFILGFVCSGGDDLASWMLDDLLWVRAYSSRNVKSPQSHQTQTCCWRSTLSEKNLTLQTWTVPVPDVFHSTSIDRCPS